MKTIDQTFRQKLLTFLLRKNSNKEQGYVLVIALGVVLGLSGLVALYAKTSRVEQYSNTATVDSNSGFYGAEAGLNLRANRLREAYLNYEQPNGTNPTSTTACFDDDTSNNGTGDFACDTMVVGAVDPRRGQGSVTTYVVPINNGEGTNGVVPRGDAFQGLNMVEYGHSVYSLAFKDNNEASAQGKQAVAILQMDVKSRLIPMFQFAAFYTGDLEIFPSPPMTLNGPVHTNGNLYLGSSNILNLRGQVTTVKNIFHSRKHNNETFPDGRVRIANATGNLLNLLFGGTGSTTQTQNAMDPTRIKTTWGTQVQVQTDAPVSIPTPSILNNTGEYYQKADIRIEYKPAATSTATLTSSSAYLTTIPFAVTAINRSSSTPVETVLTSAQLASLRQPVMAGADLASIPSTLPTPTSSDSSYSTFFVCTPTVDSFPNSTITNWWNALTTAQKNAFRLVAQDYVRRAILSQNAPVRFSLMTTALSSISSTDSFLTNMGPSSAPTSFSGDSRLTAQFNSSERTTAWSYLRQMTPQQIAGLREYTGSGSGSAVANTSRCFVSAPLTDIGRDAGNHRSFTRFHNEREDRDMRILQLNLQSLAIWNRDGIYLDGTNLTSTNNLLYTRASVDNAAPANSFQRLGLASADTSHGGMVIHATIDGTNTSYSTATGNQSRYGFALINGKQLLGLGRTTNNLDPTGLTVATNQGLYVQGDYNVGLKDYHTGFNASLSNPTADADAKNRVHNKQPAGFLADTFYPLSNTCINMDQSINHRTGVNCDTGNGDTANKVLPSHTEQNVAILSGTDISGSPGGYNGGLENYPRFLENWSGREWRYKGSFVSISTPIHANGAWGGGDVYSPPLRPWDYDTDFNDPTNLPPLTPQFVSLKQESFIRSFEQ